MKEDSIKPEDKIIAFYVRVSTPEQAKNKESSPVSQHERCGRYWTQKYPDCQRIKILYYDVKTAATDDRESYQRLLADIKAGKVFAVVATEISRLSRSVIRFAEFVNLCKDHHVQIHCLQQNFDSSTNTGWLMMMMFATMAQFERQQISERTSANIQSRKRRGLWIGKRIFGYDARPKMPGYLDINIEQAAIIRMFFDKYLELGSYAEVANWAYQQKIRSHRGSDWKASTVLYVLRNAAYIGKTYIDGKEMQGVWEPIIPLDIWQQVQDLLDQNYRSRHSVYAQTGYIWRFSNLLYCPYCNCKLETTAGTSKTGIVHYYYRHNSRKRKQDCKLAFYIPAETLDNNLCKAIAQEVINERLIDEMVQSTCQELNEGLGKQKTALRSLQKRNESLSNESSSLVKKMAVLPAEQIKEFIEPRLQEISTEKKVIAIQIAELQSEIYHLESRVVNPADIRKIIKKFIVSLHNLSPLRQKKAIRTIVEKVDLTIDGTTIYLFPDETDIVRLEDVESSTEPKRMALFKLKLNPVSLILHPPHPMATR